MRIATQINVMCPKKSFQPDIFFGLSKHHLCFFVYSQKSTQNVLHFLNLLCNGCYMISLLQEKKGTHVM